MACFSQFLGAFAKLSKSDDYLSHVCLSVRPSVRMQQLGSNWKDFNEIWYLGIFRKSIEKIQVLLKSDKNKGCLTWRPMYIDDDDDDDDDDYDNNNNSQNEKYFGQKL